jgi:hypothetical protein
MIVDMIQTQKFEVRGGSVCSWEYGFWNQTELGSDLGSTTSSMTKLHTYTSVSSSINWMIIGF